MIAAFSNLNELAYVFVHIYSEAEQREQQQQQLRTAHARTHHTQQVRFGIFLNTVK